MKLLFSTDTDSGTITVIDLDKDPHAIITKIPVGNGPRGAVRFTKYGRGFVTNHAGNTVSEIDAISLREVSKIIVGIAPIGVALVKGDGYLLVSNSGDNTVSIIDIHQRREVHTVPVGREPRHPDTTPDGAFAYVPISGADHLSKIDLRSLSSGNSRNVREIKRIFLGAGTMPYSAAVSPNGEKVVAANNQEKYVSIIDTMSDNIIAKVDVGTKGSRGTAFTPDSEVAFVSIEDTSEVIAIDLKENRLVDRFAVGPGPRGLLYDAPTMTIMASAFARTQAIAGASNSVSLLRFSTGPLAVTAVSRPQVFDVRVGAGPCSVSLFNTP